MHSASKNRLFLLMETMTGRMLLSSLSGGHSCVIKLTLSNMPCHRVYLTVYSNIHEVGLEWWGSEDRSRRLEMEGHHTLHSPAHNSTELHGLQVICPPIQMLSLAPPPLPPVPLPHPQLLMFLASLPPVPLPRPQQLRKVSVNVSVSAF